MKTDNGAHVIVCRSYGDYRTYACTVANAQAILETHRDALAPEILEVSELFSQSPRTVEPVSVRLLREALDELLSKNLETPRLSCAGCCMAPARVTVQTLDQT